MHARIVTRLAARLAPVGLDLLAPFPFAPGNDEDVLDAMRGARFGHAKALAIVIGSSRALHAPFFETLAREPSLRDESDPLDRYVERHVASALEYALDGHRIAHAIRYAHAKDPTYVPIQRLGRRAGLVALGASGLGVHPVHGPWVSLRAVIAIDVEGPAEATEVPLSCVCDAHCGPHRRALEARVAVPEARDLPVLYDALVAMRDACPVGRAHRYDEDALRYHTTKDRAALDRAVRRFTPSR